MKSRHLRRYADARLRCPSEIGNTRTKKKKPGARSRRRSYRGITKVDAHDLETAQRRPGADLPPKEFTAAEQNYWKQGDTIQGEWHGKLAETYGLRGAVGAQEFARLSEGQDPRTGEQLIRHRAVQQYQGASGQMIAPVEHRAGWDATFSAPKSISLTALVGGDDRVREAHRNAVSVALDELERYTQARIGGNHPAQTTGRFIAAKFERDTARPVDGYAAPQLHTHVVIFNITQREEEAPALCNHGHYSNRSNLPRPFTRRSSRISSGTWAMRSFPVKAARRR